MMSLLIDDDAFDYDVVGGDNDDGGLNWGTQVSGSVGARPFISAKFPLNLPNIFLNTGSAPVWILYQIICNRLVASTAAQPRYRVNFKPLTLW